MRALEIPRAQSGREGASCSTPPLLRTWRERLDESLESGVRFLPPNAMHQLRGRSREAGPGAALASARDVTGGLVCCMHLLGRPCAPGSPGGALLPEMVMVGILEAVSREECPWMPGLARAPLRDTGLGCGVRPSVFVFWVMGETSLDGIPLEWNSVRTCKARADVGIGCV